MPIFIINYTICIKTKIYKVKGRLSKELIISKND